MKKRIGIFLMVLGIGAGIIFHLIRWDHSNLALGLKYSDENVLELIRKNKILRMMVDQEDLAVKLVIHPDFCKCPSPESQRACLKMAKIIESGEGVSIHRDILWAVFLSGAYDYGSTNFSIPLQGGVFCDFQKEGAFFYVVEIYCKDGATPFQSL